MKIVKFKDGNYGIRRWSLFNEKNLSLFCYEYFDLTNRCRWLTRKAVDFVYDCRGEEKEVQREFDLLYAKKNKYNPRQDKGVVVNESFLF